MQLDLWLGRWTLDSVRSDFALRMFTFLSGLSVRAHGKNSYTIYLTLTGRSNSEKATSREELANKAQHNLRRHFNVGSSYNRCRSSGSSCTTLVFHERLQFRIQILGRLRLLFLLHRSGLRTYRSRSI